MLLLSRDVPGTNQLSIGNRRLAIHLEAPSEENWATLNSACLPEL